MCDCKCRNRRTRIDGPSTTPTVPDFSMGTFEREEPTNPRGRYEPGDVLVVTKSLSRAEILSMSAQEIWDFFAAPTKGGR